MTRTRNRRGEGNLLRGELIDAAARLLEIAPENPAIALRAVAHEVGIAPPSIYRHFADKDQLVEAVLADRFAQLDIALQRGMADAADPGVALRGCCAAYCRFGLDHPGTYRVLFAAVHSLDPARPPERRPGPQVFDLLVGAVQSCIDADVGHASDPVAVATNIWVALHGIVSLRNNRPDFPWPPVDALIDAALFGQAGIDSVTG